MLKYLLGRWSLTRKLVNASGETIGTLKNGVANFKPMMGNEDALMYEETGTLITVTNGELKVRKTYIYTDFRGNDEVLLPLPLHY